MEPLSLNSRSRSSNHSQAAASRRNGRWQHSTGVRLHRIPRIIVWMGRVRECSSLTRFTRRKEMRSTSRISIGRAQKPRGVACQIISCSNQTNLKASSSNNKIHLARNNLGEALPRGTRGRSSRRKEIGPTILPNLPNALSKLLQNIAPTTTTTT